MRILQRRILGVVAAVGSVAALGLLSATHGERSDAPGNVERLRRAGLLAAGGEPDHVSRPDRSAANRGLSDRTGHGERGQPSPLPPIGN